MSVVQIEQEIQKLPPEDLDYLKAAIQALRRSAQDTVTPEDLAGRREWISQVLAGKWSADLPDWEEMRALDKEKSEDKWAS